MDNSILIIPPANEAASIPDRTVAPGREEKMAKEFEAVLLDRILQNMKKTIGQWGFEKDGATRQAEGLFWLYLAKDLSNQGGLGIWKDIYQFCKQRRSPNGTESLLDDTL